MKKMFMKIRANWKCNWPWIKKIGIHIFIPTMIWMVLMAVILRLIPEEKKQESTSPIVVIQMVGFYAIWIMGFHRAKLLSKENPSYIASHFMYGFTLIHLGMFLAVLLVLGIQNYWKW